jgi:hypothetical protein
MSESEAVALATVVRRPSRNISRSILSDGGECPEVFLKKEDVYVSKVNSDYQCLRKKT